jgi:hypothetical protein
MNLILSQKAPMFMSAKIMMMYPKTKRGTRYSIKELIVLDKEILLIKFASRELDLQ